jgi:hypothetical protein
MSDYPRKCYDCKEKHCRKECPAMMEMMAMDTRLIKGWAKEHNRLHNQIEGEFRIFSIKCKHRGVVLNSMLPHVGRCFHHDAANYTQGCTNCSMMNCPVLNLERY